MSTPPPAAGSHASEGFVQVPGGTVHYRLVGPVDAKRTLVFENGWGGSFHYAYWLGQALAAQVRVLFYDRAGVGKGRRSTPPTAASFTEQLAALLKQLGIPTPVVVIGHSYGGLMGVLHAAQSPALVAAVIAIDPTPEFQDPLLDAELRLVPVACRYMQLMILLGLDGPLLAMFRHHLPAEVLRRLRPGRFEQLRSMNGSLAEFRVQGQIRQLAAGAESARQVPRLVISANPEPSMPTGFRKWLVNPENRAIYRQMAHRLHQQGAAQNGRSHWLALPYDHVGLVTQRSAAEEIAARTLAFLQQTVPEHGATDDAPGPHDRNAC